MLVYGDHVRTETAGNQLAGIADGWRRTAAMPPGIERHAEIAGAFIEAGALLQGIADAEFAARGHDAASPAQRDATDLLMRIAGALRVSWTSGFADLPLLDDEVFRSPLLRTAGRLTVKLPEGYAFYAVYPEGFLAAAAGLRAAGPWRVVGIRSIGTSLAAAVASGLDAPAPVSVRPTGHPFDRRLALAPDLASTLTHDADALHAIVDEGPGLSGSSFGAVADRLEEAGVAPDRIHFFPSHDGDPGPQASPRHRARWAKAARHVVDVDALVLRAQNPAHRLETWLADLDGPLDGPLQEISAGAWRSHVWSDPAIWPPIHAGQERRKFLFRAGGAPWLAKFAGLGRIGRAKVARARALHAAGFTPEPAGFRHGFLVERWIEGARPLDPHAADRAALVRQIGRYLAFRARTFPAPPGSGASPENLLAMARHNAGAALGETTTRRLDAWMTDLPRLAAKVRLIETDNRLHAWEWLALRDGRLIKTDALDHHAAHDLVGCQDIAWDIAGATVELDLDQEEADTLRRIVERESGHAVDRDLLAFALPCYLAFQLGAWTMAADAAFEAADADRARRAAAAYARRLERVLDGGA